MFEFESQLEEDLMELEGAEDFLNYFAIPFDPSVVHVNRLHILQRFHDLILNAEDIPDEDDVRRTFYASLLTKAYGDFVGSDAREQKVLQVYKAQDRNAEPAFVPMSQLLN
ncbi:MAG: nitrogenase-stabilizing/protective protein NifW [Alphaproteobacteria bacterium]|nr:nitrogenase-stabilizing/protective protein NifW [Alphaproteobacteria bacterium]MBF0249414.1 nitrogenase-stabilizing/protective protein NifW [Alphaproteobacteria bacterium]